MREKTPVVVFHKHREAITEVHLAAIASIHGHSNVEIFELQDPMLGISLVGNLLRRQKDGTTIYLDAAAGCYYWVMNPAAARPSLRFGFFEQSPGQPLCLYHAKKDRGTVEIRTELVWKEGGHAQAAAAD